MDVIGELLINFVRVKRYIHPHMHIYPPKFAIQNWSLSGGFFFSKPQLVPSKTEIWNIMAVFPILNCGCCLQGVTESVRVRGFFSGNDIYSKSLPALRLLFRFLLNSAQCFIQSSLFIRYRRFKTRAKQRSSLLVMSFFKNVFVSIRTSNYSIFVRILLVPNWLFATCLSISEHFCVLKIVLLWAMA